MNTTVAAISASAQPVADKSLPKTAGLCLKPQHYNDILSGQPNVGWFEVHAENYLGDGGAPLHYLEKIRQHYPLSIHGVGMSIGSADGLDQGHLQRVANLVHIDEVQTRLQRPMLLENPSNYLALEESVQAEAEFINNVIRRTGCGLLLDVNNVYISAQNCGYSAQQYIEQLPLSAVSEVHLAGHSVDHSIESEPLLIDAHDREVCDEVWALFAHTVSLTGAVPALIEWDTAVPSWSVFIDEMDRANSVLRQHADCKVAP